MNLPELDVLEETLLITLAARAVDAESSHPLLADPVARQIAASLEYDWQALRRSFGLQGVCLRARVIDEIAQEFLARHPTGTIIELGCGLDSRFERVDNGQVQWIDLDQPAVIELRRAFFVETPRRRFLSGSAFEATWIGEVRAISSGPWLILSEGSTIYAPLEANKDLLRLLSDRLPGCEFCCDLASQWFVATQRWHPQMGLFQARIPWSVSDPRELVERIPEGLLLESIDTLRPPARMNVPLPWSWMLTGQIVRASGPLFRNLYRVAHFRLGQAEPL